MSTIIPPDPDQAERRCARRASCAADVTVRQRGRFAVEGRLVDLTVDGCRIAGAGPFAAGGELWVRLPGLETQVGRIAWSNGGATGTTFARPLHPAVAARFLPAASRLALVHSAPAEASPAAPAEPDGLSRRERILRGFGEGAQGPLEIRRRPATTGIAGTIKRHVARRAEHRLEPRYSDAVRTGPMSLTIGTQAAQVCDVSTSGIKLRIALRAEIGETVPLQFAGFPPLEGKVVWLREDQAGLSLAPDSLTLADE